MPFTIDSDCGTVTYHFIWRHDVPVLLKTVRREEAGPNTRDTHGKNPRLKIPKKQNPDLRTNYNHANTTNNIGHRNHTYPCSH